MKTNLAFEFSVNDENNLIAVKREFAANIEQVWNAWTESELLDQWWAPKPYRVETKSMRFSEGGEWFYAMVSPEGEKHWCRFIYPQVSKHESFRGLEIFCDEDGNEMESLPKTEWSVIFNESEDITTAHITLRMESEEDLKMIIEMGFQEGFEMALQNLDSLLEKTS